MIPPGKTDFYQRWKIGESLCQHCSSKVKTVSGIICGNFSHERIPGYRCSGFFHAKCYCQHEDDNFSVLGDDNADNSLMGVNEILSDDPKRFKEARDNDHMMLPFQCDMCHFVNIQYRLPVRGRQADDLLLMVIRRANLDSFWVRERSTIRSNFSEAKRSVKIKTMFMMEHRILLQLGPFPLKDIWGVGEAACFLWRTLDPGKNSKRVQFGTARKYRTFESTYAHASMGGLGATFIGVDNSNYVVTNAATNSE